jgi:hypothetical protein
MLEEELLLGKQLKMLAHYFRECSYLKSVLKQYSASMRPGKYRLFPSMRAMALHEPQVLNRAETYFAKKDYSQRTRCIVSFLNRLYGFTNDKQTGCYEAIYTANNYDKIREVKLFSFSEKRILTICTSELVCAEQISQYEKWHRAFKMPAIKKGSSYANSFEIAMVELKQRPPEIEALRCIVQSTKAYQSAEQRHHHTLCLGEAVKFAYEDHEMNILMTELTSKIGRDLLSVQIPLCSQHGDLSQDNLLYGESDGCTDYWWIDWEHAGERVFFYDLFFYMLNSAVYANSPEALDCYISGECDKLVRDYFAHFGMAYDETRRKDYFLIFVILFLKERVCDCGRMKALRMYYQFLDEHKLLD